MHKLTPVVRLLSSELSVPQPLLFDLYFSSRICSVMLLQRTTMLFLPHISQHHVQRYSILCLYVKHLYKNAFFIDGFIKIKKSLRKTYVVLFRGHRRVEQSSISPTDELFQLILSRYNQKQSHRKSCSHSSTRSSKSA